MSQVMLDGTDSQLARLVQQASDGEEIIMIRGTVPIAKIVPMTSENPKPIRSGYGTGEDDILYMADDFDAPIEDFKDYS